jgi:hypothetical protein
MFVEVRSYKELRSGGAASGTRAFKVDIQQHFRFKGARFVIHDRPYKHVAPNGARFLIYHRPLQACLSYRREIPYPVIAPTNISLLPERDPLSDDLPL